MDCSMNLHISVVTNDKIRFKTYQDAQWINDYLSTWFCVHAVFIEFPTWHRCGQVRWMRLWCWCTDIHQIVATNLKGPLNVARMKVTCHNSRLKVLMHFKLEDLEEMRSRYRGTSLFSTVRWFGHVCRRDDAYSFKRWWPNNLVVSEAQKCQLNKFHIQDIKQVF